MMIENEEGEGVLVANCFSPSHPCWFGKKRKRGRLRKWRRGGKWRRARLRSRTREKMVYLDDIFQNLAFMREK